MLKIKKAHQNEINQDDIELGIEYLQDASSKINQVLSDIIDASKYLSANVFSYDTFKFPLQELQGKLEDAKEKANQIKEQYPSIDQTVPKMPNNESNKVNWDLGL